MQTITIGKQVWQVAASPGDEIIGELQRSLRWSVSEFKNDGKWRFEPLTDSTIMPAEAWHRKDLIEGTGIEVNWVIAHEILPEPIELPEINISDEDRELVVNIITGVIVVIGLIALAPLIFLGLAACSSNDPALLAVVKNREGENVWLNCYRFY
jgi:hypothetical protein